MNRNRVIGGFEEAIETGQVAVKNSAKQAASDFTNSAKGQIVGTQNSTPQSDQGTNEAGSQAQNSTQSQMTDEERVDFLRNLYGKSDNKTQKSDQKTPPKGSGPVTQTMGVPQKDPHAGKSPEEIAKLESLRKQLHADYYQNLVNRPKPKEEPVTEKLEREEEQEKMTKLAEEKKKPPPLPATVKQGTGEMQPGVSG